MTTLSHSSIRQDSTVLLGRVGLAVAVIATLKFVGILAAVHWDLSMSPWGFFALFVTPFVIARLVLARRHRIGAMVAGIPAAMLAAMCASAIVNGIEPYFVDYLVVFVGGPLALATAALAVRVGVRG